MKEDALVFGRNGQSNAIIPKAYFELVSLTLQLLDIAQGERVSVGDFPEDDVLGLFPDILGKPRQLLQEGPGVLNSPVHRQRIGNSSRRLRGTTSHRPRPRFGAAAVPRSAGLSDLCAEIGRAGQDEMRGRRPRRHCRLRAVAWNGRPTRSFAELQIRPRRIF